MGVLDLSETIFKGIEVVDEIMGALCDLASAMLILLVLVGLMFFLGLVCYVIIVS